MNVHINLNFLLYFNNSDYNHDVNLFLFFILLMIWEKNYKN